MKEQTTCDVEGRYMIMIPIEPDIPLPAIGAEVPVKSYGHPSIPDETKGHVTARVDEAYEHSVTICIHDTAWAKAFTIEAFDKDIMDKGISIGFRPFSKRYRE